MSAPLPPADHAGRRDRLRARLAEADLDALVVTHLVNVRYVTGFTGSAGTLVITADPATPDTLLTDGRYAEQAADEAAGVAVDVGRGRLVERVVEVAGAASLASLGFEADRVSWETGEALTATAAEAGSRAVAASGHVEALRAVKDAHELAALTEGCRLTCEAFGALLEHVRPGMTEREVARLLENVRPGMTERDVARLLERTMEDLGAEGPAFPTIAASGPNGARPHHRADDRRIEPGDLLTVDFGARVAGYHADMTRTVAIGRGPVAELRRVHDVVRAAQQAGVDAARSGVTAGDLDAATRGVIDDAGYGERFVHPTGHAVGLEIHEHPTVAAERSDILEAGTTITVEPGIYLPGTGGVRIEDTVEITPDGPARRLTTSPRELLVT